MIDDMQTNDIEERVFEQRLKGHCCSETIMELFLKDLGRENKELVRAMAAFCGGMGRGKICGTLAAAIAALHIKDSAVAENGVQDEFMDWFEDSFGAFDCDDIIHGDDTLRMQVCPGLVMETYVKLREYL